MLAGEQHSGCDSQMRASLRLARYQHLALVVAVQSGDHDGAAIACSRLANELATAQQILDAAQAASRVAWRARLEGVRAAAHRWMVAARRPSPAPDAIARLAARAAATAHEREPRIIADGLALPGMNWDDLHLERISAPRTKLTDIWAQRAILDAADLSWARLRDCHLEASTIRQASFWKAVLQDTHLDNANLTGCTFTKLTATFSCFLSADLRDTWLDGAMFTFCDFQNALLGSGSFRTTNGALFLRSDLRGSDWTGRNLRGATFAGCKVHGSRGDAAAAEEAEFLGPDLSPLGDGSQIGSHADVVALWRASAPVSRSSARAGC